jgi:hypothetical protein
MKPIVFKYGIIAGLIVSISMVISMTFTESSADMSGGEIIGFAGMFIAFSSIFFAIVRYRKEEGGLISFGKAFQIGLYIALITSTLYVISWMILSETLFTDFGDVYYDQQIKELMESDLSEAEKDTQLKSMEEFKEAYKNPIYKFFITYLEILPVGLIISLIAAAILKRNRGDRATE